MFTLPGILIYTFVFGIVGNCLDYSKSIAASGATQEQTVTSNTYYSEPDMTETNQVQQWKAGISEYTVVESTQPMVTTTVPTVTNAPATTTTAKVIKKDPPAILTVKPFTLKLKAKALNAGSIVKSNPPAAHADGGETMTVIDARTGKKVSASIYDIVCHVTAQEIDDVFQKEAIKAQAVAAYTFLKYTQSCGKTPTVNLNNTVPSKISAYVKEVYGLAMYYNGKIIYSPYCASTGGATASNEDVNGASLPYLVSVASKYDNNASTGYYKSTKTFTAAQVKKIIEDETNIKLSNDPSKWFAFKNDESGVLDGNFVGKMLINQKSKCTYNGKTVNITGVFLANSLFNLKSSKFDISYANGKFTFTSYGYGPGVGMPQVGANLYASKEKWTFDQILKHYYTGVTIK